MKQINQSCQGCCFGDYALKLKATQTGCKAGYIDKFRKLGDGVVLEAYNEAGEFYLIDGYKCPAFRQWEVSDLNKLKEQLKLKIDVFVLCGAKDSEESIVETVKSFDQGEVKPRKVYLLLYENIERDLAGKGARVGLLPSKLIRNFDNVNLAVDISESLNKSTQSEALDRHLIGNDSAYYVPIKAGEICERGYLDKVNSLMFDQFKKFIFIKKNLDYSPDFIIPDAINTKLHNELGGNKDGRTIQEKLEILDAEQKDRTYSFVLEGESLWNSNYPA